MIETITKLIRTSRMLVQDLGREPTSEENWCKDGLARTRSARMRICSGALSLETRW